MFLDTIGSHRAWPQCSVANNFLAGTAPVVCGVLISVCLILSNLYDHRNVFAYADVLQLMTEKGNHIKVRRQLEQLTSEHAQLVADCTQLRDAVAELTSSAESFTARELELKITVDRLTAELRAVSADRDRLTRELEDRQVRDAAIQDNIQVCIAAH